MKNDSLILEITKTLALLTESGLTLQESLEMSNLLFKDKKACSILNNINNRIEKGSSFSDSIDEEIIFPPIYRGMIKIGELVGSLSTVFQHLDTYLETQKSLNEKIRSAMIYPVILLIMILCGIVALILFLIPGMRQTLVYSTVQPVDLDKALNAANVILFSIFGIIFSFLFFSVLFIFLRRKSESFAYIYDYILIKSPFIGSFVLQKEMFSLNFALSVMTSCSIPIEEAFTMANHSLNNNFLKEKLKKIRDELIKGNHLSLLFSENKNFPPEMARWIGLGERIGKVDKVFSQLKTYYENEINKKISRIIVLIEPAASLLIGSILLIVIMFVILPILTIYGGVF